MFKRCSCALAFGGLFLVAALCAGQAAQAQQISINIGGSGNYGGGGYYGGGYGYNPYGGGGYPIGYGSTPYSYSGSYFPYSYRSNYSPYIRHYVNPRW